MTHHALQVLKHPWVVQNTAAADKTTARRPRHTLEYTTLPSVRNVHLDSPSSVPAAKAQSIHGGGVRQGGFSPTGQGQGQVRDREGSGKQRLDRFKQGHATMATVLSDLRAALPSAAGVDATGARRTSQSAAAGASPTPVNSKRAEEECVDAKARVSTKPSPTRKLSPVFGQAAATGADASRRSTLESGPTEKASVLSALESPFEVHV